MMNRFPLVVCDRVMVALPFRHASQTVRESLKRSAHSVRLRKWYASPADSVTQTEARTCEAQPNRMGCSTRPGRVL